MDTIITIIYLLAVPMLVMQLSKRWKWIEKISPMTVLYIIGLAFANLLPESNRVFNIDSNINTLFSNLAVPIAIPLMLMGCSMGNWQIGKAFKVFLSGLVSILIVTVIGFFLFQPSQHTPDSYKAFAQICAVATGIYTGGIPNMGAIKQAVGMPHQTYLYITSYDLIVTGLYLVFVIFFGKTVFRKLLPAKNSPQQLQDKGEDTNASDSKVNPFDREHYKTTLLAIGITLIIAAISYVASLLLSKDGSPNMTMLILLLTTLAIAASFIPPMKKQQHSFDLGLYCVYVFCLAIATACNIREMDIAGSLTILYYLGFIILGSLVLQIIFAKLMKIDGDAVMVCSVALINSPPFVPLAAALLNNKNIVVLGITIGLLGYMLGNYLGIGLYHLLLAIG
ncbi:MAG: DUF819 family protein [Bacteroidales bacterium]|nr:DUF819 family protein [Bacteroidales bacterium]